MAPNDFGYGQRRAFNDVLREAIAELSASGYLSPEQIADWLLRLRTAAEQDLGPLWHIDADTRAKMHAIYTRLVERSGIERYVPGISRFGLAIVRPELRSELDRRIIAAAELIKLNWNEAVESVLRRFQGWATSIPVGGDGTINKRETRSTIGKSMAQFRYEKRRCEIDQSMKLVANISEIVAMDAGAVAGIWHDHGEHDKNYHARKEHLARSGHLFLVRDSWAIQQGLVKRGSRPYMDEITKPGVEPYCRCWYQWITSPRRLPDECLTREGQAWVTKGKMAA